MRLRGGSRSALQSDEPIAVEEAGAEYVVTKPLCSCGSERALDERAILGPGHEAAPDRQDYRRGRTAKLSE